MNTRIENLTRNYLASLNLSRYQLDDNQKQDIIRLNNQTNWLIFNAGSLTRGGHREVYNINSPQLRELLEEQIKIYHQENWRANFDESADLADLKITLFNFLRYRDWIGYDGWIAVNKTAMGEGFGATTMDIGNADLTLGEDFKKVESRLDNLLTDPDIRNSRAPSTSNDYRERQGQRREETPPPNENHSPDNNSTTQSIQFVVKKVDKHDIGIDLFIIELVTPLTVNGQRVTEIEITGRKVDNFYQTGDLQAGKTITITNINFTSSNTTINNYGELSIGWRDYDEIKVVPSNTPLDNPQFFPEVRQKNQELAAEENNLLLLAAELLEIVDEKNKKVCQEGQTLGLNLSELPANVLDYFQEEFFQQLDENQSLNSSHNSQTNTDNDKIKQKKLNIKNNIYRIYNSNSKKLTDKKQEKPDGSSPPPENELAKIKRQIIEEINKIVTNPDNLRNIDLITLANGKYQDWENDIERLTTANEVTAYGNAFLAALKETGVKEKEEENNKIFPLTSPQNSSEKNIIDNSAIKMINSLPLADAKKIAKNRIRELFKEYRPDIEKLKEVWQGEKSWMAYLEKCDSPEKIVAFLEKLQQEVIAQKIQNQESNHNKKPTLKNSWFPPLIITGFIILVGLIIIVLFSHKRKRRN